MQTIEKLFNTPNIEEWVNKQIQIGSTRINAFGEMTDCLRVRPFAPKLSEERPAVQTGSVIWKNILDALAGGYTVTQVLTKYKLTKEQIKELQKHEISNN